ncbi:MAG: hypothetical protein K6C36_05540 [Clostridia bacterium]|nr:hypothetical protein [Clostridia bacterium]
MVIEFLYSDLYLYGDEGNVRYLRECVPDARLVFTEWGNRPYFADSRPDLLYMGSMSEKNLVRTAEELAPFAGRLAELRDDGAVMLFTGNAVNLLGAEVRCGDKSDRMLGLYPFGVGEDFFDRYNSPVLGSCDGLEVIGFSHRFDNFTAAPEKPFMTVENGRGCMKGCALEGVHDNNLFATYTLGPLLVMNPLFTERLLGLAGSDCGAAFGSVAEANYRKKLAEFKERPGAFHE